MKLQHLVDPIGKQSILRRWSCTVIGLAFVASLLLFLLLYQANVSNYIDGPRGDMDPRLNGMTFVQSASFNCSELGLKGSSKQVEQRFHYHEFTKEASSRCQSKYQHYCFREKTGDAPLKFLESLRDYEAYHERCTKGGNLTELGINGDLGPDGCKYLVWKSMDGMGNQLLSLVCAFVYSLLTKRAMLIATDSHIEQLLCEPFPNSSWLLPDDFPEPHLRTSAKRVFTFLDETFAAISAADSNKPISCASSDLLRSFQSSAPKHLYTYIVCCDERRDHQFFCPSAQKLFEGVNWMFYHSHEYTLSAFYFVPEFRAQLNEWFPTHDVFMHVSRYLLNPVNHLWAQITKVYKEELDGAKRRIAFQPRAWGADYNPSVSRQIQRCSKEKNLLPQPVLDQERTPTNASNAAQIDISVLVTSLKSEYWRDLNETYEKHPNDGNLAVRVWTASNEGWQKTGDKAHDEIAIVDIWLLSFMQELVITPFSTFGSTATGLAGLVPLLFNWYGDDRLNEVACERTNVAGPCFIVYPRSQPCDLDPPRASIFDPNDKIPEVKLCAFNPGLGIQVSS